MLDSTALANYSNFKTLAYIIINISSLFITTHESGLFPEGASFYRLHTANGVSNCKHVLVKYSTLSVFVVTVTDVTIRGRGTLFCSVVDSPRRPLDATKR